MKHQYLYGLQKGEKVYGIPDDETLEKLLLNGSLTPLDMLFCYRRGMWSVAGDFPELRAKFERMELQRNRPVVMDEALRLSDFASVGCTKKIIGRINGARQRQPQSGPREKGMPPPSAEDPERESGRTLLLIIAIALLLLVMSFMLAAKLYISCVDDTQLSYQIDKDLTSSFSEGRKGLPAPLH